MKAATKAAGIQVFDRFNKPRAGGVNFASALDRTQQHFKDECDINVIVRRHLENGDPGRFTKAGVGTYGDFYSAPDFQEAQEVLLESQAQFDALPARVRDRFFNSPARLLEFVADKANIEEARRLGLLKEEAAAAPPAPGGSGS